MISLPNCVLNDSHRGDGHVYLLVGNYFSDAASALTKLRLGEARRSSVVKSTETTQVGHWEPLFATTY